MISEKTPTAITIKIFKLGLCLIHTSHFRAEPPETPSSSIYTFCCFKQRVMSVTCNKQLITAIKIKVTISTGHETESVSQKSCVLALS